jgi:hypothetical protein
MPVTWTDMSGDLHDVKVAIDKYVAQRFIFDEALSDLNEIHTDIMRKENSLKRRSLEVIIQKILKYINFSLQKLSVGTHFVVQSGFNTTLINEKFTSEAKTLYPIMAALVIRFKKAKELLERVYINTSLYTPLAEVPSRYKIKLTDGFHWRSFEQNVNKMGQEPKSHREQGPRSTAKTLKEVKMSDLLSASSPRSRSPVMGFRPFGPTSPYAGEAEKRVKISALLHALQALM